MEGRVSPPASQFLQNELSKEALILKLEVQDLGALIVNEFDSKDTMSEPKHHISDLLKYCSFFNPGILVSLKVFVTERLFVYLRECQAK